VKFWDGSRWTSQAGNADAAGTIEALRAGPPAEGAA